MTTLLNGSGVIVTTTTDGPEAELTDKYEENNRWICFKMVNDDYKHLRILRCGNESMYPLLFGITTDKPNDKFVVTNHDPLHKVHDNDTHIKLETQKYRELKVDFTKGNNQTINLHYSNNILFVSNNYRINSLIIPPKKLKDMTDVYVYIYLGYGLAKVKFMSDFIIRQENTDEPHRLATVDEKESIKDTLKKEEVKVCRDIQTYVNYTRELNPRTQVSIKFNGKGEENLGDFKWNESLTIEPFENNNKEVKCTLEIAENTIRNGKVVYTKKVVYDKKDFSMYTPYELRIRQLNANHNFINGCNVAWNNDNYTPKEAMSFNVKLKLFKPFRRGGTTTWNCKLLRIEELIGDRHTLFEEVIEKLGEGGFASVAFNTEPSVKNGPNVLVAKMFHSKTAPRNRIEEMINLQMVGMARSNKVLTNFDPKGNARVTIAGGNMRLVPGKPLSDVIESDDEYSYEKILTIMYGMALELEKYHEKNMVFRDFKPDNVMYSYEAGCILVDLGSLKPVYNPQEPKKYNISDFKDGITWKYASPEAVNHLKPETHYCLKYDIYSLGISYLELLNRKMIPPRSGSQEGDFVAPPPSLFRRRDDKNHYVCNQIMEECEDLIKLCVHSNHDRRPTIKLIHETLTVIAKKFPSDRSNRWNQY